MRRTKTKRKNKVIILAIVLMIPLFFLYFFGRFLVIDETPVKADTIILLSGDVGRLEKSVSLMNSGYADKLILTKTNGRGRGEISLDSVIRAGVPKEVILPEYEATSTYTNAVYSKQIMLHNEFKSALVVSSNYHMRRVQYTFDKVYKDTGIELIYVAAPSENFDPKSWWSKKNDVKYGVTEYLKLLGYIVKY